MYEQYLKLTAQIRGKAVSTISIRSCILYVPNNSTCSFVRNQPVKLIELIELVHSSNSSNSVNYTNSFNLVKTLVELIPTYYSELSTHSTH